MLDRATMRPTTYIVANTYMEAMDYMYSHDMSAQETRFVSTPEVLRGLERPRVVVLGTAVMVSEEIIELLADRQAEVTYA